MMRVTRDTKRKCAHENSLSFEYSLEGQDAKKLMEWLEPLRSQSKKYYVMQRHTVSMFADLTFDSSH